MLLRMCGASLCLLLPFVVFQATAARGAEEYGSLVRRLGSEDFATREKAEELLLEIGTPATASLLEGIRSDDVHIHRTSQRVLTDLLELDRRRRLKQFTDGKEEQLDRPPASWARYRELIGDDRAARGLFIDMHTAEGPLLEAAEFGGGDIPQAVEARITALYQSLYQPISGQRQEPSVGTIAALLFIVSDPAFDSPQDRNGNYSWPQLLYSSSFRTGLTSSATEQPLRRLLGLWILKPGSDNELHQKFQLASQYGIEEGLELGLDAMEGKRKVAESYLAYAIEVVGKVGGKPHAASLLPMLDKKQVFANTSINGVQMSIQARDVALAWLVYLTGQDHSHYGFPMAAQAFEQYRRYPQNSVSYSYFGFRDDDSREAAQKKWREWNSEHELPAPPPRKPRPQEPPRPPQEEAASAGEPPPAVVPAVEAPQSPLRADRAEVRRLTEAARLLKEERFLEAARLLGEILAADEDFLFAPPDQPQLVRGYKGEAERLLSAFPAAERRAYVDQFGAAAREALEKAIPAGAPEDLAEVGRRYFFTPSGEEALYLAAELQRTRGRPLLAAWLLGRLRRSGWNAERFEPRLSLVLAACLAETGLPQAAAEALAAAGRNPREAVLVGGQEMQPFAGDYSDWLVQNIGIAAATAQDANWPVRGGAADGASLGNDGPPFLQASRHFPLSESTQVKESADMDDAGAVSLHPLLVDGAIVYRSAAELLAVDAATGEIRWRAASDDSLRFLLTEAQAAGDAADYDLKQAIQRRLFHDPLYGSLSSDGRRIFAVEGLSLETSLGSRRLIAGEDGRPTIDPGVLKPTNRLTAYDLNSGKIAWEIATGSAAANGPFFLGPPLPLGDRLFGVVQVGRTIQLWQIDSASGEVLGGLGLTESDEEANGSESFGLPMQAWKDLLESLRRHAGAQPAAAGGTIVCPAGLGRFVAVDLARNAIAWRFQLEEQPPAQPGNTNQVQQQLGEALAPARGWREPTVAICGERALLGFRGDDRLFCLELKSGNPEWHASARGLFIGGVTEQHVLVAGRGKLTAWSVANGQEAWQSDLPDAAFPAGRGFLFEGRFVLPLSSNEVAVLDASTGDLVSRSRAVDGRRPGNLIPAGGRLVSLSPQGMAVYPTLESRREQTAAALRDRPQDAAALADHGEALLYQGDIAASVEHLRRALEAEDAPRTRRLLVTAVEQGLSIDPAAFRESARELAATTESNEEKFLLLRRLAEVTWRSGSRLAAFEDFLSLADFLESEGTLRVEAGLTADHHRWLAARLEEVRSAATAEEAREIDERIVAFAGRAEAEDESGLEFLKLFPLHPLAIVERLSRAERHLREKEWFDALTDAAYVVSAGGSPQRGAALALMAEALHSADRPREAAQLYQRLTEEQGDVVCRDGKTGVELLAALPDDDPVRGHLSAPAPWPKDAPRQVLSSNRRSLLYEYPLAWLNGSDGLATPRLHTDQSGGSLVGYDPLGQELWRLSMQGPKIRPNYSYSMYSYSQAAGGGGMLAVWLGDRVAVVAMNEKGAELRWSRDLFDRQPTDQSAFRAVRQGPPRGAEETRRLVVGPDFVCFQRENELVCADLATGRALWSRDDLPEHSDLVGDARFLLVTPPDSPETQVLSALDGGEISRVPAIPLPERLAIDGRFVFRWQSSDAGGALERLDPATGEASWRRQYPAGASACQVGSGEAAILDREGGFSLVSLNDGVETLAAALDPPENLEGLTVMDSPHRLLILTQTKPADNAGFGQPAPAILGVSGPVHMLDRSTGKALWSRSVEAQAINVEQSPDAPLIAFFGQHRREMNNATEVEGELLCLDASSGRTVLEQAFSGVSNQYAVAVDPAARRVEIGTQLLTVRLDFPADE